MISVPVPRDLGVQIDRALEEDIGSGDLTAGLISPDAIGRAAVITREAAILCGIPYVEATFGRIDPRVRIDWKSAEGAAVAANQTLFEAQGPARALLTGERIALNFLQLLPVPPLPFMPTPSG
jgi:nicotinate-nucleotide pyrophosphorylase (carboxylating)